MLTQKYARLTVIEEIATQCVNGFRWRLQCDCGKIVEHPKSKVVQGGVKSCGCLRRDVTAARRRTHGMTSSKTYNSWRGMLQRCAPSGVYAPFGIKVCARWKRFENFLADMGERPPGRMTIDRIDFRGDYEPSNCRWATYATQAKNRRMPRKNALGRFCGPSSESF